MSDESTPGTESAAPQAEKKPRSPVERVLVWVGIIVLLLLVGVQAHARFGYNSTLQGLEPLINDDFEGGEPLALADVDRHLVGFPSRSDTTVSPTRAERAYHWRGLGGSYGITLVYNPLMDPPVVTELVTDGAPEPEEIPVVAEDELPTDDPMAGMPGSHDAEGDPGGGGPGGGGGQFDPMQNDADGDGRLSLEEASERMQENFGEWDTDGDGFVDESEIEARVEQFRQERGERDGDGEDRPQRPAIEESGESNESTEEAPAEGSDEEATPEESAPDESSDEDAADTP